MVGGLMTSRDPTTLVCGGAPLLSRFGNMQRLEIAPSAPIFADMAIRLRVGDLLEERGMTAYQLAKKSGGRISLSAAYRLAEGNAGTFPPSWVMLETLCDVLKVDVCDLFHRSTSKRSR